MYSNTEGVYVHFYVTECACVFFLNIFCNDMLRYGIVEPKITHNLVHFAGNLPESFDPVAKRKALCST